MERFKFYAVGLVVEDKSTTTHMVEVVPIDKMFLADGVLSSKINTMEVSGEDDAGKTYTIKMNTSLSVKAIWLPMGSNRITSPDLVRNEHVFLWKYGDNKEIYWTPAGLDDDLRRLETAIYGFAATDDKDAVLDPLTNMYTVEFSAHKKHVTLRTTKGNGEPFVITMQINAGEGAFTLTNEEGVKIEADFVNDIITILNASESHVILDKKEIKAFAKDLIYVETPGKVHGEVGNGGVEVNSSGPVIVRAPTMQLGEDDAVQPSVLGDNHAAGHTQLETDINNSRVIGNLGIPTSTIAAVKPIDIPNLKKGGESYSTVNTNQ